MCRAVTRPLRTVRGTTMVLLVEAKGSVRWTTRRPSFAIVTMLRHRLTFLILVIFLEGRVPCFKCA